MGRGRVLVVLPLFVMACWARESGFHRAGEDVEDGGTETLGDGAAPANEPGNEIDAGADTGPVDDGIPKRLVFITSDPQPGYHPDGLKHFDGVCNSFASGAGIETNKKFAAWLSSKAEGALKHIKAEGFAGKYVLPNGEVAFKNVDDLTHNRITKPITVTESGSVVSDTARVWTGTNADGTYADPDCKDWTEPSPAKGWTGKVSGGPMGEWTHAAQTSCDEAAFLYCFEVP